MLSGVVLAAIIGLGYGFTEPEIIGFCAWNSILSNTDSYCASVADHSGQDVVTRPSLHPLPGSSAGSNQTDWDGPKHCTGDYCVYSHRRFAGGIVVITNRENAKRISNLPETTGTRTGPPPFYATEVPGKGTGLVANRTIKRGEPIMTWQPTFMIHRKLTDDLEPDDLRYILDAALNKLPAPRRRAFLQQLGQFGGHRVSDILLTNAFQMDVGEDGDEGHHLGNFPDVSRFNHDCRPNVAFRIDEKLTHHTHAVRDIPAGEELTLSYMNPFETHAVRQQHILRSWGFQCTCQHCSMSEEGIRDSDARLYEIDELEAELGDFTSSKASVKMVERLIELYRKERLDAKDHGAYVLAALNYNLFGDAKNARKFANLAVEAGIIEYGENAEDVEAMRVLARDPSKHFTWMKRLA
ncbi:SET domain-containing protein 5 [Gnomoniopsis smithogilvyi]|uniref:SET domain-containing protein 5 n=1 Tax=Gnomoniopsis smithogilvyi TaxID=1191159 RepID=A0A9W9D0L8_9PEZI|nr:SET domain-containing protein 5 [Gnomoniopsis smithogilvyi]